MFDLSDQICDAMCNPSDQISDNKHEIVKQLREQKLSEYYKHLEVNLQSIFSRYDEIFSWYDEIFFRSDEIFDKKNNN